MTKIIVATGNENKMKEIRQIIKRDDIQFVSLKDEGLSDVEIVEDGDTFEENAIIKAKTMIRHREYIRQDIWAKILRTP